MDAFFDFQKVIDSPENKSKITIPFNFTSSKKTKKYEMQQNDQFKHPMIKQKIEAKSDNRAFNAS